MLDKDGNHIPGTAPEGVQTAMVSQRTSAEIGSPEFAEDRTQINSLNNKHIFESAHTFLTSERAQLSARLVHSFDSVLSHANQLQHLFVQGLTDKARYAEGWEYNRMYDVANPVAVATGNNITAGGVPANRITDTSGAVAGGAVNAGIAMSTLNNVTAQVGILQTMVSELAQSQNTANTAIAATFDQVLSLIGKLVATAPNPTSGATA